MAATEWERFFDGHAPEYMSNVFTGNTLAEVEFLLEVLDIPPGGAVLDVGCGTGRHSVELAKRGFAVTGVDLSSGMLAEARKAAEAAGGTVDLVHSDAASYKPGKLFDAAICLCEGAFGLLGTGDDPIERDLSILRMISAALKPGGGFMLTALSACRMIRARKDEDVARGAFDPATLTDVSTLELGTPSCTQSVTVRERGFVATELVLMFRIAGLEVRHIWGGTAGNWGPRPISLDEYELMLVACKCPETRPA